jgi:hypothetical protein
MMGTVDDSQGAAGRREMSVSWEEELLSNNVRSSRVAQLRRAVAQGSSAMWLAVVLPGWIVAVALSVLAPFQPLVTVLAVGRGRPIPAVDGWGRTPPDLKTVAPHGANVGIALSGCAGSLMVLVLVVSVVALAPTAHRGLARLADGLAIAAPSLLAGVTGSLWLYTNAYLDELRRIGFARPPTPPNSHGTCLWLAVAALMTATASTTLYFAASRTPSDQHRSV